MSDGPDSQGRSRMPLNEMAALSKGKATMLVEAASHLLARFPLGYDKEDIDALSRAVSLVRPHLAAMDAAEEMRAFVRRVAQDVIGHDMATYRDVLGILEEEARALLKRIQEADHG